MLADDDGVGAVGGRSVAGDAPPLALAPERVRRCDFGGRRLLLVVFAMPLLCTVLFGKGGSTPIACGAAMAFRLTVRSFAAARHAKCSTCWQALCYQNDDTETLARVR